MDITGINKAELLAALYNGSKVQGLGFLQAVGGEMTTEQAHRIINERVDNGQDLYFDYLRGKVMKLDLSSDDLHVGLYNRDNGIGSAEKIIERLKAGQPV